MSSWNKALIPFMIGISAVSLFAQASIRPAQLRCEYRVNPLGIDVPDPRLSWVSVAANAAARGLKQSAYQIVVNAADGAVLWDSGKTASDRSAQIAYAGKPLASGAAVSWKVRVWDQDGKASAWSDAARWSMGLLNASDWKGKWIGRDEEKPYRDPKSPYWSISKAKWIWAADSSAGMRYFRTKLNIPTDRKIKKVTCVITAEEAYNLFWNGTKYGRKFYTKMPEVYDMTPLTKAGELTIAVSANTRGNKRPAGLIVGVRVDFEKGEPMMATTTGAWKSAAKEEAGWEKPGFNDSAWAAAREVGAYGVQPWGEAGLDDEHALPARHLRKEFEAPKKVKRAMAYVSGLGLFELFVNGAKVSDDVLSPGLTDYTKRAFYVTYDVTSRIVAGKNAVGLMLGNGRFYAPRITVPVPMVNYGFPKAIAQIEIEYTDGSKATVATDETWKLCTAGPVRANNEYDGEDYDARMELKGWDRAGFDDAKWAAAQAVAAPAGALMAQMAEPIRVTETLKPVKIKQVRPGVYVYDMGQNMVGWVRLRVAGAKGTEVKLRFTETLLPDGNLYIDNLRSARATDTYILKGGGPEVWEPRFTYHGFRYVEISGYPGTPTLATIDGRVVHDNMTRIADFASSNELLNKIHKNILWGMRGNYRSIPTDCPQRDERHGWLGDRSTVSRSESYMHDVAAFYTKWETDIADAQKDNGSVPVVAPAYWQFYHDDVTWPSTFLFVPNMLLDQYGDTRVIERNYPAMKKWIAHMREYIKDDLMPRDTYGDWCVPPEDPKLIHSKDPARKTNGMFIGTAYFYHMLRMMERFAKVAGKPEDAKEYEALAVRLRDAFEKKYYNASKGIYDNGTQTANVLPIAVGITPEQNRKAVLDALTSRIDTETKGHIGVGLIGAQWLMRTLSDYGRADVAYKIASQKDYPGWGYMVNKGATTIWELWNGDTADPGMNSGNHVMQIGDLGVWLYSYLGGIRPDPENPGYRHAIIRPVVTGDLTYVKASHRSMQGLVSSHWKRTGNAFDLNVIVPPNATATIYVPAKDAAKVTESGAAAAKAKGVKFVRTESGAAIFEVGSGSYAFHSEM